MEPDPNDPHALDLQPEEREIQRKTSKEWLFVYGFVAVLILIIALTAWHLSQGH